MFGLGRVVSTQPCYYEITKFESMLLLKEYAILYFADDKIRIADLWYQKLPLCQLSHNHLPIL